MKQRIYVSDQQEQHKNTHPSLWNFIGYSPGDRLESNESQNQETTIKKFIRIFKDEISAELWRSYCMGLGLNESDPNLKSFRIYIESPADIKIDEYTESGEIINNN